MDKHPTCRLKYNKSSNEFDTNKHATWQNERKAK